MLMMHLKWLNRHYEPQSIDESTYMRTKCGLLRLTTGVSRSNNLYLQGCPGAPIIIFANLTNHKVPLNPLSTNKQGH